MAKKHRFIMWTGTCAAYGFGFGCSISDHVGQLAQALLQMISLNHT